ASPTPADVPFSPLTSPYVRTALMKDIPTSGPMPTSSTHQARDTISSRHSLFTSHRNAGLGERKKHLFQVAVFSGPIVRRRQRGQFPHRALAAHAPAAQQDEPV